jgi:hypothetical protein
MSKILVSCVTGEFGGYRARLDKEIASSALHWVAEEAFPVSRSDTVVKLDTEIQECDAWLTRGEQERFFLLPATTP